MGANLVRRSIVGGQAKAAAVMDQRPIQAYHPFTRLNTLLEDVPAGRSVAPGGEPINLALGEPQGSPPAFVAQEIVQASAGWSRYPLPRGTEAYRAACCEWLNRRYDLPQDMIDPDQHILPLPGTREGLFFAALALTAAPSSGRRSAVLMPNPFYHVYAGAALAADAEPVFVSGSEENGGLPDYTALAPEILQRTGLSILCSPSNPQGAVASRDRQSALIALARRYDFAVAFDECYSELYYGACPPGALQVAAGLDGILDNILVFHSLSKRSSAPGLRCGFAAGDATLIAALDKALRVGGAGVPLPVLAAGTRLWRDETHVETMRAGYAANFALADRILGDRFGYRKPDGGFFLWLDVGDGESAAVKLWRAGGIRVLPGGYLCAPDADGRNPGERYIRVALVHAPQLTEAALTEICAILTSAAGDMAKYAS